MKVAGMVVNWLTADQTLRAVNSIRKYYPDMFIYIVNDGEGDKPRDSFFIIYHEEGMYKYDPDISKLQSIPDTKFISLNHHVGHGAAIDYASTVIEKDSHAKWIFHLDSDARLIKSGIIEYMLKGVEENICQIGAQKPNKVDSSHIHSVCMMYRNDLVYSYGASMRPTYATSVGCGGSFCRTLKSYNFQVKHVDISSYYTHLRNIDKNDPIYVKYY